MITIIYESCEIIPETDYDKERVYYRFEIKMIYEDEL